MERLVHLDTSRINPDNSIKFTFQGKPYQGVEGDTIATALYAGGLRILSRSLKYHRPRGLYSLDGVSSNCFVKVDGIPNVPAEITAVKEGMVVQPQNVIGSPDKDRLSFLDKLGFAMPTGFYYRTMHKPKAIWPVALKLIRKAAGIGTLSPDFELKGVYDEIFTHADVCVIGGGPAGMMAALAAASQGLRVILLEKSPWMGGSFEYRMHEYQQDLNLCTRARKLDDEINSDSNIRIFKHAAVTGIYNNNLITAFQKGDSSDPFTERYIEIRAHSIVVATGCIERPLLFENNDRPGVMQVGCAHRLVRTYGIIPGQNAVFCVGHDLGLEAAVDLFDLGLSISCVADLRAEGQNEAWITAIEDRKIPFYRGWTAEKVHGKKTVGKVTLTDLAGNNRRDVACDTLVASAGLSPLNAVLTMAHATLKYDDGTGYFLADSIPAKIHPAGRVLGYEDPHSIVTSGRIAGLKAAIDCGARITQIVEEEEVKLAGLPGPHNGSTFVTLPSPGKKTFICFDADATIKDMDNAIKTGFDVPELIKRYTAAGTGPGQGGIPGHNLPLYVRQNTASSSPNLKPTTTRSPLVPTYLATYAGTRHDMSKQTPVHDMQVADGGRMDRIGAWNRARYFSDGTQCRDEIENVRNNVGILDASTLGKFRIFGPDALNALQRVYVGDISKLSSGKIKYSAMCNEDGCIIDDGVIIKRAEDDYYFTTSTGRAGDTAAWIRYHTRYDHWDYKIVNLTDAFGVINLAGPNARRVLEKITDEDVSDKAFPFAAYREFSVSGGVPVRSMRLGFVGELSYELHVPASYIQGLWKVLAETGKEFGINNFGLEAQNCLRLEKCHIIIGSESEQRTTLHDVGLGFLWDRSKPGEITVGVPALIQTENQKGRLKLVGFKMEHPADNPPKDGSIIVDEKIRGYVCTARYSFSLREPIGLALVEDDLTEYGTELSIYEDECNGQLMGAKVVAMPFYDPEGTRMKI